MAKRSIIFLISSVVTLLVIGFVMLASASYYTAEGGDVSYSMIGRQGLWLLVGCCFGGIACFMNYDRWMRWRTQLFIAGATALVLCLVPGVGVKVNGSRRWLGLDFLGIEGFRLQPSEFAKIALACALAGWYARHDQLSRSFVKGFVSPAAMVISFVLLIGAEMDLGSSIITACMGAGIMIVGGAKLRYLPLMMVPLLAALALTVVTTPNRWYRVVGFASEVPVLAKYVDLESLPKDVQKEIADKKLQQKNARMAFGSGGVEGVGAGLGRMKLFSLPEAHTDFIFSQIGEELGLRGTMGTLLAFVCFVLSGMCIAAYAPNRFGKLLGFGITWLMGLEGLMNMAVTTGLIPNKGLPMPLVSYGGSSLVVALISVGILVNIFRQGIHIAPSDLVMLRRKKRWTPQL
jgi:cell division protein FtsW